jgi:ferredoxin--NADP+ reductase
MCIRDSRRRPSPGRLHLRETGLSDERTSPAAVRVAVIGAGPAGFFTADQLLKNEDPEVSVDLFERWPTPYGLVREGVAPDHQSIKGVTRIFDRVLVHPRLRFFGNVRFGEHLTRDDLVRNYDQVVYAVGAQTDRHMDIPGEDLAGSWPATDFVRWYNGQPECVDLDFDLGVERAVVIGNGNVAVDVARILLTDPDVLARTDIADHALEALRGSAIREVVMVGRRGPAQAKFTNVELKELGVLDGVDVAVDAAELERAPVSEDEAGDRRVARNLEILEDFARREPSGAARRLVFRFLASPVELSGDAGAVRSVRLERNRLVPGRGGSFRAEGTGEFESMEAGLVLRSVGYHGVPLPGVPFDEGPGVIPSRGGRMLDAPDGDVVPGEYVVGWIKRGPSGVIGTNKACASETVTAMLEDAARRPERSAAAADPDAIIDLLSARNPDYVTEEDWARLDAEERARGEVAGRPRVKVVRVEQMLELMGKRER